MRWKQKSKIICILLFCLPFSLPVKAQGITYIDRHYQEGLLLLQQGRYEEALSAFNVSLTQKAQSEIYFALGVAYFQLHQLSLAKEAYQQGLKLLPSEHLHARLQAGLGDLYFENRAFSQAISAYQNALQTHPEWTGVRLQLANAYLRLEYYQSALAESEALMQTSTPLAEIYYLRGLVYLARQDWASALKELNQLSAYPEHFNEAQQHLNLLYRLQKNYPKAIQTAEQLIQSDQNTSPLPYQLAAETRLESLNACLPEANCLEPEAIKKTQLALERWLLIAPNQAQAYYIQGQLEQLQGHWKQALKAYQKSFRYFPERLDYRLKLASMLQTTNQRQQAYALLNAIPTERFTEEALWHEFPKWATTYPDLVQRWLSTLKSMNLSSLHKARLSFWQDYFDAKDVNRHRKHTTKQEYEAEKLLSQEAEGLMIQAFKLWRIDEQEWAAKIYLQAHQKRSDWWLPQVFLGKYYMNKNQLKARQWLQAAYRHNPISLPLALDLLKTYSVSESPMIIHDLLQSFPEEQQFQTFYLEMLQDN